MQIGSLQERLRGPVTRPGDDGYDAARALYNGMIDKRPAAIVHCADVADVMATVRFAADQDVLLAIRGGGHNGPGLGSCDDGLVLDLSGMNGVRVDPARNTVRVDSGCTQGAVDHAGHPFGLAVPAGIVSTTGIAGLTLGGGHGYLSRRWGLTVDNLLEADVVLADGSFVTCSERQHEDLFWALRGGGGNFGVVTSFEFRGRPVNEVYGGPIFFDVEHTREVMQWYREWIRDAPREMYLFCGMKKVPDADPFPADIRSKRICALIGCWSGEIAGGEKAFGQVLADLPQPMFQHTGPMPYPMLQSLFDPLFPPGLQWYWKGDFVRELPDEAIDIHVEHGGNTPTSLSLMHLYPINGAVHDVAAGATAFNFRDVTWSMVIAGIDPDPKRADGLTRWARNYWESLQGHTAGGAYVNFMMDEGQPRVQATYGPNHDRLVEIKTKYDPRNVFRVNQNIRPQAA